MITVSLINNLAASRPTQNTDISFSSIPQNAPGHSGKLVHEYFMPNVTAGEYKDSFHVVHRTGRPEGVIYFLSRLRFIGKV